MKRALGVCYYPEHWPRSAWEGDARRMAGAGLSWVRIGEFAWSRLEPAPGEIDFGWLDEAIGVLGAAGLKVVLGTPTATPPRWMLDRHPDMLAVDAQGRPRGFGSRRHYCFSHEGYRAECARIAGLLAERYGRNPHVAAWQTDNEYGCHATALSYSDTARAAFRGWLRRRHGDVAALNAAWGNVFWSMEYGDFEQIDLPNLTVTEPNPAHVLDFRRFSSDQVASFNRLQVEAIRARSDAPIAHNYMGRETGFDHYALGGDLDIASWDSYPLGFLEDRVRADAAHKRRYARQGDPDFQAFHHDLCREVGRGRWWVMEQQPGPVNWAPFNPAPLPGMVRLWTWEAFAHGAETVCYFRWRQAPMAQEQMHAGLLRPDGAAAPGLAEAERVAGELADAPQAQAGRAEVALVFDYEADWMWSAKPHGRGLAYFDLVFDSYRALRRLGLSVDVVRPDSDFCGRRLVVLPGLMHISAQARAALSASGSVKVAGPRSGACTGSHWIQDPMPPAIDGLDATVARVETLREDMPVPLEAGGEIRGWRETLEGGAEAIERTASGEAAAVASGQWIYVAGWFDSTAMLRVLKGACAQAGVATLDMPEGLRRRDTGAETFWFNHTDEAIRFDGREFPPVSVTRIERG